jgi:hypothetical protein
MHLDLTDEQAAGLIKELHDIVENDPYPFSSRVRVLRDILSKLRPEPVRGQLPPPKHHEPPRSNGDFQVTMKYYPVLGHLY